MREATSLEVALYQGAISLYAQGVRWHRASGNGELEHRQNATKALKKKKKSLLIYYTISKHVYLFRRYAFEQRS
jgi:hypothetical protein